MATSVHLLALAVILLLCAPRDTAQISYDPPWSNEYWANEPAGEEQAVSVAARRAEAGGYAYGCARLWLAMGCPPAPGKGVNGSLVDGRRSYDRELDRFEDEMRHCSDDRVPLDPYLRHPHGPATSFDLRCCACCYYCVRHY